MKVLANSSKFGHWAKKLVTKGEREERETLPQRPTPATYAPKKKSVEVKEVAPKEIAVKEAPMLGKVAIIEQLLADGIHHMVGNPGTSEEAFLDVIKDYPEFEYILTLQESIAVAIADGISRKTHKPSVVQLHAGVGLGNAVGMMYQALRGSAPMVVLAGEAGVKYEAMDSQLATDLVEMAKPVTKWAGKVNDINSLMRMLRRAIKIASTAPTGPVFLSLPQDILEQEITEPIVPTTKINTSVLPAPYMTEEVARVMMEAKNPLILVGDGISFSNAQDQLVEFAELTGSRVCGVDSSVVNMPASHYLHGGLTGHVFGTTSKKIVEDADAVLICGTYVFPEIFPSLKNVFREDATVMHIDLNTYDIAKNFPVDIALMADPKEAFTVLNQEVREKCTDEQKSRIFERTLKYKRKKEEEKATAKALYEAPANSDYSHFHFLKQLSETVDKKDVIIFDEAITCSPHVNHYFPADIPGQFFQLRGGSLGVGVPSSIGINLMSESDKTVIAFTGDGGSMYTIQALWTAAHHEVDIKIVICNNHSYNLLKVNIEKYWGQTESTNTEHPEFYDLTNPNIDFVKMSESMGVDAMRVTTKDDIPVAINKMLNTKGPVLIDLLVNV